MCRMGEQINTLIRTVVKPREDCRERERTNEAMVRPTVYGHMVNTVTCSLLEKPRDTHAVEATSKAAVFRRTQTRATHTCA